MRRQVRRVCCRFLRCRAGRRKAAATEVAARRSSEFISCFMSVRSGSVLASRVHDLPIAGADRNAAEGRAPRPAPPESTNAVRGLAAPPGASLCGRSCAVAAIGLSPRGAPQIMART
jgi:hypothetical protein